VLIDTEIEDVDLYSHDEKYDGGSDSTISSDIIGNLSKSELEYSVTTKPGVSSKVTWFCPHKPIA
jgi:hypothetical protein